MPVVQGFGHKPKSFAVLLCLAVAVCPSTRAVADAISEERRAELGNLLVQDCGSCHGLTMSGGLGAPLLPARLADRPDAALIDVILEGIPGTPMPGWRPLLTADEAGWMVRRLKEGVSPGKELR